MGKWLPETCWADSKINKIVIVASIWSFILFTYIDDAGQTQIKYSLIFKKNPLILMKTKTDYRVYNILNMTPLISQKTSILNLPSN